MRKYVFFSALSWLLVFAGLLVSVFALWSGVSQLSGVLGAVAFLRLALIALGALVVALIGGCFVAVFDLVPALMRRLESVKAAASPKQADSAG
ncbi:MAG: hypothetical protein MEQ07_10050 [Aquimonas sp.]|nr:hypothetical protein [Aquimonas sp.]